MTQVCSEEVMERVRTRKFRAALRLQGRQAASAAGGAVMAKLIAAGAPDYLTAGAATAYMEQLRGQCHRMVGHLPAALPTPYPDEVAERLPHWADGLCEQDRAEIANGGWPAHVQVWRG